MKRFAFISSASAVFLAVSGCVKVATDPVQAPEPVALRATITSDNHCTVEVRGTTYTSIDQLRGATPPSFVGTLDSGGYHAVGCWVAGPNGNYGDLTITFPGNSLNEPFRVGTFTPTFEPPYGSSANVVAVTFRSTPTFETEKLRTIEGSTGTVTVTASPTGARTITVDVTAIPYQT